MQPLCLDHLSLSELTALELIDVAAALGCTAVSLFVRPLPLGPYRDLVLDLAARKDVKRALKDTGLSVGIVEPFMLDDNIDWDILRRSAALTAELGGVVNTLCFQPDLSLTQDSMCQLAEMAQQEGARIAIESFTLSSIRTLEQALNLAVLAGPHVGLTIDTLHVIRTGGTWSDVSKLPPERIFHVQLNDGFLQAPDDLYLEATLERKPPGDGEFNLKNLMPHIPETACIAVEAPFRSKVLMTPIEKGRVIVTAAQLLCEENRN